MQSDAMIHLQVDWSSEALRRTRRTQTHADAIRRHDPPASRLVIGRTQTHSDALDALRRTHAPARRWVGR